MDEIIRELTYGYHKRQENLALAWNIMRGTMERHAVMIESLAVALNNQSTQYVDTELLIQSRQFYHPETICLALLFLNAQYDHLSESISPILIQDTMRLIQYIDTETIRYGGPEVINIAHKAAKIACQDGQAALLIRPLVKLSLKLCPNHTHLNSIDADILQVCISAHMYSIALNFLSTYQFDQLEPNIFPVFPVDILRFFYYRGIIYISAKRFHEALESFDQVISVPAVNMSTIALEAYKKACLVSLIRNGKKYHVPSYASNVFSRIHKLSEPHSCSIYQSLGDAFVADNFDLLSSILNNEHNKVQFNSDGNFGLTKQVYESFFVNRIVNLSKIYSTITPDRILRYVNKNIPNEDQQYQNVDDIEKKLRQLFLEKRIFGHIDKTNNIITFFSENEGRNRLTDCIIDHTATLQENMKTALSIYSSLQLLQQDAIQSPKLIGNVLNTHLSSGGGSSIRNGTEFD